MLVRVKGSYKGFFGAFDGATRSIRAKRAGDPPFELDDEAAAAHIRGGILESAAGDRAEPAADWNGLKARAKELGINPVGKSKAALEQLVREAGNQPAGGEDEEEGPVLEMPEPI